MDWRLFCRLDIDWEDLGGGKEGGEMEEDDDTKGDTTSTRVTSLETADIDDMDDVVADADAPLASLAFLGLLPPPGIQPTRRVKKN